jgi:hypothetical protein
MNDVTDPATAHYLPDLDTSLRMYKVLLNEILKNFILL